MLVKRQRPLSLGEHRFFCDRSLVQVGVHGWGPAPHRFKDNVAGSNSFKQRSAKVTITNRVLYFGYDLFTTVGIERTEREFDSDFKEPDQFDDFAFFVRTLIGFTEHGPLI